MPCNTHVVCFPQTLICLIDKKTGEKTQVRPRFIKQDQVGVARLEVNGGIICLETFKDFPQMGRFTLRDEGHSHFLGNVFVDGVELLGCSAKSDVYSLTLTSSLYYQPRQSSARGVKMWPQKHNFKVYLSVLYIILKEIDLSTLCN
jgi:hypothetical protein